MTDPTLQLRQAVTHLRIAVVLLDAAWILLLLGLIITDGRPWTIPVSVVAFLAAQALAVATWRVPRQVHHQEDPDA